mmetsp:Transcript_29633/g.26226  ORF Transcript_29633/g.26226 Transcript_29633/m.26226 type:complete len:171 (-) Transcript_29633:28-540(-)
MVEQVNQIWVEKREESTEKFYSNEYMKRESHRSNSRPLNIDDFFCYRMIHFYTKDAAIKYYEHQKLVEKFSYISNYKNIKIDGLNGIEFKERQLKNIKATSISKQKKKVTKRRQKEVEVHVDKFDPKPVDEWNFQLALTGQDYKDIDDAVLDSVMETKDRLFAQLKTIRI